MRHQDDGGVEARQVALEPLQRLDVEVVRGLVEQQQVRVARERPGERGARELAAREGRQPPVELFVGEAQPVHGPERPVAPVPAPGVLQPALRARVAVEQSDVVRALGHLALEPPQVVLERHEEAQPDST